MKWRRVNPKPFSLRRKSKVRGPRGGESCRDWPQEVEIAAEGVIETGAGAGGGGEACPIWKKNTISNKLNLYTKVKNKQKLIFQYS